MTGGPWDLSAKPAPGVSRGVPTVGLARKPTAWELRQPSRVDCGPTCVLFLRLGGGVAGKDPRVNGRLLSPQVAADFVAVARRYPEDVGPLGVEAGEVAAMLREYAPAGTKRLEVWRPRPQGFSWRAGDDDAAFLRREAPRFRRELGALLERSPRGVACQFLLTSDDEPLDTPELEGATQSHWVVVVGVREGQVDFYDPDQTRAERGLPQRRKLHPELFLAGHIKGWNSRRGQPAVLVARGQRGSEHTVETALVAAEADRVHAGIRGPKPGGSGGGTPLFQIDPSAWPWDGQDLSAGADAEWYSEVSEAEAAARELAARGRSVALLEYGEAGGGAFAVVPLAEELDAENVSEGMLDESDSPERGRRLAVQRADPSLPLLDYVRGSAVLVFSDGTSRAITAPAPGSHRRRLDG